MNLILAVIIEAFKGIEEKERELEAERMEERKEEYLKLKSKRSMQRQISKLDAFNIKKELTRERIERQM